jgi:threonine dehydratase
MTTDYLTKILNAQVYDVAIESPLEAAPNLSARLHNTLLLKREDMQEVFSFKLRGAYNKMAHLPKAASTAASSPLPPATMPRAWRWPRSGSAARPPSSCR